MLSAQSVHAVQSALYLHHPSVMHPTSRWLSAKVYLARFPPDPSLQTLHTSCCSSMPTILPNTGKRGRVRNGAGRGKYGCTQTNMTHSRRFQWLYLSSTSPVGYWYWPCRRRPGGRCGMLSPSVPCSLFVSCLGCYTKPQWTLGYPNTAGRRSCMTSYRLAWPCWPANGEQKTSTITHMRARTYTHTDVYKRTHGTSVALPSFWRWRQGRTTTLTYALA